ncbi:MULTISPECIES: methionine ABC transporter permease [unclassified Pseudoclavibacter]|uniref:methionine ABC transporter permease n=1 Tax=unclassified Pseudoclavibacter TaxID=2615177 RepID=UPI001300FA41|nr:MULTISPECIES: methionine ABC transporter permease [unclassified Pseudoclavibacter]KAB1644490.1 ABC transporter permease [Pseudoclavibacter sp. CFCC 14310]KAB1664006.1 ABC transporter permease [Pseudoclavibacter sp. CFCC 13611]
MFVDWSTYLPEYWAAIGETLFMVAIAGGLTLVLGLSIGTLLHISAPGSLTPHPVLYHALSTIVNLGRSIPFLILIVLLIPLTRILVGTSVGVFAAIVPLTIGFTPFFSRLVESALREVDEGRIEAAKTIGLTKWQIITRVLLPESFSGLLSAATIVLVGTVDGTAVAGAVGAGGIGDFALLYGYQRFYPELMLLAVLAMVIMVQAIQLTGDIWIRLRRHKR